MVYTSHHIDGIIAQSIHVSKYFTLLHKHWEIQYDNILLLKVSVKHFITYQPPLLLIIFPTCFLKTKGMMQIWISRDCDSMDKIYTSSKQNHPTPGQEDICNWYFLGWGEKSTFLQWHRVYQPHSRAGPRIGNNRLTKIRLYGFLCVCVFVVVVLV